MLKCERPLGKPSSSRENKIEIILWEAGCGMDSFSLVRVEWGAAVKSVMTLQALCEQAGHLLGGRLLVLQERLLHGIGWSFS